MALKMRKSIIFAIICAASLAALMGSGGGGQCQAQPYQVQQYPPPPAGGPQGWVPAPRGSRPPAPLQDVAERIWRLANEIRGKYGIPPLAQDGTLASLAQAYCDDMLRRRFFSHTNPEGLAAKDRVMPFYPGPIRRLGENIWKEWNMDTANSEALARFIINSWMKSPGHRDNLLAAYFSHLGVGVAASGRGIRAVQIFAHLQP